jgi:hypothetical protein
VLNPTDNRETIVPKHPIRTTGFLPSLSERAPQKTEEQASARAKAAIRIPA